LHSTKKGGGKFTPGFGEGREATNFPLGNTRVKLRGLQYLLPNSNFWKESQSLAEARTNAEKGTGRG